MFDLDVNVNSQVSVAHMSIAHLLFGVVNVCGKSEYK